MKALILKLG